MSLPSSLQPWVPQAFVPQLFAKLLERQYHGIGSDWKEEREIAKKRAQQTGANDGWIMAQARNFGTVIGEARLIQEVRNLCDEFAGGAKNTCAECAATGFCWDCSDCREMRAAWTFLTTISPAMNAAQWQCIRQLFTVADNPKPKDKTHTGRSFPYMGDIEKVFLQDLHAATSNPSKDVTAVILGCGYGRSVIDAFSVIMPRVREESQAGRRMRIVANDKYLDYFHLEAVCCRLFEVNVPIDLLAAYIQSF
jgi:hypothetical protein